MQNLNPSQVGDSRMDAARASAALSRRFEAIASNLANLETDGFKRVIGTVRSSEAFGPRAAVKRDFTNGAMMETQNPTDVALEGPGFFGIEVDGDVAYRRALRINTNESGYVVDQRGNRVLGEGGPLRVQDRTKPIEISQEGDLLSGGDLIGRMALTEFDDRNALRVVGPGLYGAPRAAGARAAAATEVHQGSRERSNVDALEEMVALITVQRQFEASQRAMHRSDRMSDSLIQSLR